MSFSQDTAKKTGKSKRVVERKSQIGKAFASVADKLKGTTVEDNQKELLALSRMGDH